MKFGGTSVGDVAAFERVCRHRFVADSRQPVVVTSAMTKMTDALLAAFEMAKKGDAERHLRRSNLILNATPRCRVAGFISGTSTRLQTS